MDCPIHLPSKVPWTTLKIKSQHLILPDSFHGPDDYGLASCLQVHTTWEISNETEESVIVGPGLQLYVVSVEDTYRVVPGVQHSEERRSQAHWDMQGSCWNWFQYCANRWTSFTFHMCKRFPAKNICIIIQLPWAIYRFAFHLQDLKT